ncbi:MAG TPA: hypothetical protein VMR37_06100 [Rhabdochlamydiaceae bacterium]|jgi:Tol biopolymer transport system component|nr:hypothetical protein [Rhabdochlamydiaceae bacterium]
MKKSIGQVFFWSFFALLATGCSQRSGNMWDDNQTTGDRYKYSDKNPSSMRDKRPFWIYNFESKEERQLTDGTGNKENPSWVPDSKHLVFNSTDAIYQNFI